MARDASTWNGLDAWHRTGSTAAGLCRGWQTEQHRGQARPTGRPWHQMSPAGKRAHLLRRAPEYPAWAGMTASERAAYVLSLEQLHPDE